jgi:hypothetical protein
MVQFTFLMANLWARWSGLTLANLAKAQLLIHLLEEPLVHWRPLTFVPYFSCSLSYISLWNFFLCPKSFLSGEMAGSMYHQWKRYPFLVFNSPVQSGFLAKNGWTWTVTSPQLSHKFNGPDWNHLGPAFCSSNQFINQFRLVFCHKLSCTDVHQWPSSDSITFTQGIEVVITQRSIQLLRDFIEIWLRYDQNKSTCVMWYVGWLWV